MAMKTSAQIRRDLNEETHTDYQQSRENLFARDTTVSNGSYGQPNTARNSNRKIIEPYDELPLSATLSKWSKRYNSSLDKDLLMLRNHDNRNNCDGDAEQVKRELPI